MKWYRSQDGQTLVETVVGIFVLTIGISTALGLAVSMFNASSSAVKQVIGAGLAREGVEAVFNMRATNWLKGNLSQDCYNYTAPSAFDAYCRRDWLTASYSIDPGNSEVSYTLDAETYSADDETYWIFSEPTGVPAADKFKLYYDATASSGKLYTPDNSGGKPFSGYYREIVLKKESASYYQDGTSIGQRLKVTSRVWWEDRGCPGATTWAATVPKCRVELVTYLTNWRNY